MNDKCKIGEIFKITKDSIFYIHHGAWSVASSLTVEKHFDFPKMTRLLPETKTFLSIYLLKTLRKNTHMHTCLTPPTHIIFSFTPSDFFFILYVEQILYCNDSWF